MSDVMPVGLIQAVLMLAPLVLALAIGAHRRLRRHVYASPEPIAFFRNFRWNSCLILIGSIFLLRGAAGAYALGRVAQVCGLILALEFFYVAYANLHMVMSAKGLLMGMSFSPWRRFAGYTWLSDHHLELRSRSHRRYRLRVPAHMKASVQEIVDLNILKER